jgi:hypothetical protein
MVFVDSSSYFFCAVFGVSQWLSNGFFSSSRELRQRDPLSPFFFSF